MATADLAAADVTVDEIADLAHMVEVLQEALLDQQMALDEAGWAAFTGAPSEVLGRERQRAARALARVMAFADPLIRRGIALRTAYVWGQGVTIAARQEDGAEQDVNAVVQAFLDDEGNKTAFASGQAREELERALATDGNRLLALPTDPLTGRVQIRTLPMDEVADIVADPDDAASPWFYRRTYTRLIVEPGYAGTRTRRETRTVYYPALGFRPATRPRELDGKPIEWDTPVLHVVVNRPDGTPWGIGDAYAALPWAQAYKGFLEDWARLAKALSRIAFQMTAKTKAGAATARTKIAAAAVDGAAGQTAIVGEGQRIEAVGKSGATIDADSGRPLAAMVASALDVPVTMLLGDPGVTGARATAETLDRPLEIAIGMRRDLHADILRRILNHVIESAVRAPRGPLQGTVIRDRTTGREVVTLRGEQPRDIDIDWPDLTDTPVDVLVKAIVEADSTGKIDPLVVARLLLIALDVDNVDKVLAGMVDADGNFVHPDDAAAARAQQNAVAGGDLPSPTGPAEGA